MLVWMAPWLVKQMKGTASRENKPAEILPSAAVVVLVVVAKKKQRTKFDNEGV